MLQICQRRRRQPAPLAFWSSSQKQKRSPSTAESIKQPDLSDAVALRRRGLTLEEIANELGATRLAVLKYFLRCLDKNTRLKLALPTAAEEFGLSKYY
jgi:hypothetical protein